MGIVLGWDIGLGLGLLGSLPGLMLKDELNRFREGLAAAEMREFDCLAVKNVSS